MLKTLSKTKKIIIGASVAGAVGVGTAVVVPLALSKKQKDNSDYKYTQYAHLVPKTSPALPLWSANGQKAIESLNRTMIGNVDTPDQYKLIGIYQKSEFNIFDSTLRFAYVNSKSGQTLDLVVNVNAKNSDGSSDLIVEIEFGKVNGLEFGSKEIGLANEILLRDTGSSSIALAKREKQIKYLQELAVDTKVSPTVNALSRLERADELDKDSFDLPIDPTGQFKFEVTNVYTDTALSSGSVDVAMRIFLISGDKKEQAKHGLEPTDHPLERTVVRHVKTVSNARAVYDFQQYLNEYKSGLQDFDIHFKSDLHQYNPSKITFKMLSDSTEMIVPKEQDYFDAYISSIDSFDDEKGTLSVTVTIEPTSQFSSFGYPIKTSLTLDGFKTNKNLTKDEADSVAQQRILRIIEGEKNDLDQQNILSISGSSLEAVINGDIEDGEVFRFYPSAPEKAILQSNAVHLGYDTLVKYGFPPSTTLNYGIFEYKYYVEAVDETTKTFEFHIIATLKDQVDKQLDDKFKIPAASRTFEKEFTIRAVELAETIKYNLDVQTLGFRQQALDGAIDAAGRIEINVNDILMPADKTAIESLVIPLNPDDLTNVVQEDTRFYKWFQRVWSKYAEVDRHGVSYNDYSASPGEDPRYLDYKNYNYNLILNNLIDTDGEYGFSIEVAPKHHNVAPAADGLPEQHRANFIGIDRELIKREVDHINGEIKILLEIQDLISKGADLTPEQKAKLEALIDKHLIPQKTFAYNEINPEAFIDRSSVYYGQNFDPLDIFVPGVKNIPLTATVLNEYNMAIQTLGISRMHFSFSHDKITEASLAASRNIVYYTLRIERGSQSDESIKIPVLIGNVEKSKFDDWQEVGNFKDTIISIKQDALAKYVDKVLNDPSQTPTPIQLITTTDNIEWNNSLGEEVWYHLDFGAPLNKDTGVQGLIRFDEWSHVNQADKFILNTLDDEISGRFYTWLKSFGIIDGSRTGDFKGFLWVRVDPNENEDGTHNIELRVSRGKPSKTYQEGVDSSIFIKAQLVNRDEGRMLVESKRLENIDKAQDDKGYWNLDQTKRITASVSSTIPPIHTVIRNISDLSNFINAGFNVDVSKFNLRDFDYKVDFDGIDFSGANSASTDNKEVSIKPILKSNPLIKSTVIHLNVLFIKTAFDRDKIIEDFKNEMPTVTLHQLGRLTNNQLTVEDQTDMYTKIYLSDVIKWLESRPEIGANHYLFSSTWEYDPQVTNGFIVTVTMRQSGRITGVAADFKPSLALTFKLVNNENKNSIISYLAGYTDPKTLVSGAGVLRLKMTKQTNADGSVAITSVEDVTSPIDIPSGLNEIKNDINLLNRYMPVDKRFPHLLDGYVYATRNAQGGLTVKIYRNSNINEANKVLEFNIKQPVKDNSYSEQAPIVHSDNIYI